MAHPAQHRFLSKIKAEFPAFFSGGRVLEIGSLNINGSVRAHFHADEYVGLDVGPGPGVDVVCEGQKFDAPDGAFDVEISAECLEHNQYWSETLQNMFRLCREGGLVLMTCALRGRPEHGTRQSSPQDAPLIERDYYKNLESSDVQNALDLNVRPSVWMMFNDHTSHDPYLAAFRELSDSRVMLQRALNRIAAFYRWNNLRYPRVVREQTLISLFGERRYMTGSLLPWKSHLDTRKTYC
jgi:SAM-dependent methyltransferase